MYVIKLTNLYIWCLVASDKMSDDRAWMYTGHPNHKEMTTEWVMKTKEFLRAAFANVQRKTWCPCVSAKTINRRQRWIWVNTYKSGVLSLIIRCGPSMAS